MVGIDFLSVELQDALTVKYSGADDVATVEVRGLRPAEPISFRVVWVETYAAVNARIVTSDIRFRMASVF